MQSLAILGRQPALGLAELESLYGAGAIRPVGADAAFINLPTDQITFGRLGGSIKLSKVLTTLDTTAWHDIQQFLVTKTPEHAALLPEGKLTLGISVHGVKVSTKQLLATGLSIKKAIKTSGRPVRLVPNKEPTLNSAQVLHNNLTDERGWELLLVRDGDRTIVAQTTHVQDIDAYAARDQGRPKRDARVGMLPPKLAQIIVNLAVGDTNPLHGDVVLDPFCGTGVVLQEATLMGFDVYGTDLDPRMVEYTDQNLMWAFDKGITPIGRPDSTLDDPDWRYFKLDQGDATTHQWAYLSFIAAETYLGRPFSALPRSEILQEVMQDVNLIHKKFLQNVARQTKPGFRMCIAVPAWNTPRGFQHLKVLEILPQLGYTRIEFAHVGTNQLIYHRENQIVGRELVVLVRK